MAAVFDNIKDVAGKFSNTICLYKGKPVFVKHVEDDAGIKGNYVLNIVGLSGRGSFIKLDDPDFSYRDFNIGYANTGMYASWWYRKPSKQWRQGLKHEQFGYRMSLPGAVPDNTFQFAKPFNLMLENNYPEPEMCQKLLRDQDASVLAFHRDFALAWDDIHNDYILEYRAKRVGASGGPNVKKFALMPQFNHLQEALKEALP